jgi:hypothetical protein
MSNFANSLSRCPRVKVDGASAARHVWGPTGNAATSFSARRAESISPDDYPAVPDMRRVGAGWSLSVEQVESDGAATKVFS